MSLEELRDLAKRAIMSLTDEELAKIIDLLQKEREMK